MSTKSPAGDASSEAQPLSRRAYGVFGPKEWHQPDAQRNDTPKMDRGSVAAMRDEVIRGHLADSNLALSIFNLIGAAHNVNRWDLTDDAVNALCDAARRYVADYERALAEHGTTK